ncbi:MAG TPA: MBL fold metallo-hydrolase [Rhizomicrobium sp.]|nr:MBL fold metallo-hydrolase [Rhizomicrobium sp.]
MLSWKIGDVKVTRVVEMEMPVAHKFSFLQEATPEALRTMPWLYPNFVNQDDAMLLSIHALLVEAPGLKLVVDTCIGNDKNRGLLRGQMLQTDFLKHIAEAGFPRESVNAVVCTHLHVDHVGWNTMKVGDKWVPTFPNARYLIGKTEYEHWIGETEGETAEIMTDSVKPIFDAGLAQTVEMDHRVSPEIRLVPTPGHTPGHVSVMIESKGQSAVITGDMIHHPSQFAHPDWMSLFDSDQSAANARRHTMFEQWADKPILVIGTHFAAPTAGHVKRDGANYRFEA